MKEWKLIATALLLAAALLPVAARAQDDVRRPNIILINVDDMGWTDLACMGSDYYETPHIDQLSREGLLFTNAYAGAANCAPSRACMLSGRYPIAHGIYTVGNSDRGDERTRKLIPTPNKTELADSFYTLAEMLRDNGYRTGIFGKWHLGENAKSQGFDVNVGGGHHGNPGKGGYFSPYNIDFISDGPEGEYLTDRLTTEAIHFMEDNKSRPFFLYLPYYTVHTPIMGKTALIDKFSAKQGTERHHDPDYAAMIYSLDQNVGRLLDKLAALKLESNTLVIFTSDNGGMGVVTDQDPLRASKGAYYEGGIRVPLIIKWPGKIQPGKSDYPVSNIDFYPTLQSITGAGKRAGKLDGEDISPLLLQGSEMAPRPLFWHFPIYLQAYGQSDDAGENRDPLFRTRPGSVIRWGKWKLHEYFEDGGFELYNLEEDPGEKNNLADKQRRIRRKLYKTLVKWRQSVNAPVPSELNPAYDQDYETNMKSKRF